MFPPAALLFLPEAFIEFDMEKTLFATNNDIIKEAIEQRSPKVLNVIVIFIIVLSLV